MDKLIIIIPTYNPRKSLFELINFFIKNKPFLIIIVNDGTKQKNLKNIPRLKHKNLIYLENKKNFGKGYSIKKALEFIKKEKIDKKNYNILHCDDDYQHTYKSILKITSHTHLIKNNNYLIMGKRKKIINAPLASKIGNYIISQILVIFFKIKDIDTQNGLRLYSSNIIETLLKCKTNRFEFETEMLIMILKNHISVYSIEIETIYNQNHYSRFNKFYDTFLFIKFLIISFLRK